MSKQISLGQLKKGAAVVVRGQPHLILSAAHHKMGRGGAVARSKLKNLKTGAVIEETFQGNETLPLADLTLKKSQFLYKDEGRAYFMDEDYEQFSLSADIVKDELLYLKEGATLDIAFWDGNPLFVKLPPKVELKVADAPPAVKGDTANSPSKIVALETGLEISAPLFVKTGDVIRVNTETGEYVERV